MHSLGYSDFRQAGVGPLQLIKDKFLQDVFHIPKLERELSGIYTLFLHLYLSNKLKYLIIGIAYDSHSSNDYSWAETQSSRFITSGVDELRDYSFRSCKLSHLLNDDECRPKSWVLASKKPISTANRMDGFIPEDATGPLILGRVEEILQIPASDAYTLGCPNFLLLHIAVVQGVKEPYWMPGVQLTTEYALIQFTVCLFLY